MSVMDNEIKKQFKRDIETMEASLACLAALQDVVDFYPTEYSEIASLASQLETMVDDLLTNLDYHCDPVNQWRLRAELNQWL